MIPENISSPASQAAPQGLKPHRLIKLGVDVHWREHVVVRQIDGQAPQPAQRFAPEAFVAWVAKQVQQADVVHCCYEAGPFGFVLHRRLERLGVKNLVVRPRNWDEYGKKVKTDRRDALALVSCLDRYVAGNTEALTSIRVPTEAEEQARSVTRQREQMLEHRKRLAAQGLGCARYYGHDLPEEWWRAKKFAALRAELPEFLFGLLEGLQQIALLAHEQLETLSAAIEAAQAEELPTGLGALTAQILDREIGDWRRFKNRRQIASYNGLVPSERSSGEQRRRGAVTKHGNPRVRHVLIETSWRLQHFQPDYRGVKKRRAALDTAKRKGDQATRKKLCVGLAREFIVDWWRIRTGRTTTEKLGLQMSWPAAYVLRGKQPGPAAAAAPATQPAAA
ncbi:MAG: IS110 family transposase [Opitutae bacterium]|nr:IS110 family transposase [Opitutae bacterium]